MPDPRKVRAEAMKRFGFGPEAMKQRKVCRVCGATEDAAESFCRRCGTVLPKETLFDLYKVHHLYCPACDTVVTNTAQFCPSCGTVLRQPVATKFRPTKATL